MVNAIISKIVAITNITVNTIAQISLPLYPSFLSCCFLKPIIERIKKAITQSPKKLAKYGNILYIKSITTSVALPTLSLNALKPELKLFQPSLNQIIPMVQTVTISTIQNQANHRTATGNPSISPEKL